MRGTIKKQIAIGVEDFKEIIVKDGYFVDKTLMIKKLIEENAKVTLFMRPRRFGKTLNQFMLRRFFEDERTRSGERIDNGDLFDGLKVAACGEEVLQHQQQYPVIFLSLKSAKQPNFEEAYKKICKALAEEFRRHQYLLEGNSLADDQKIMFQKIMTGQADYSAYNDALKFLSECLWQYHGKNTMILIDEYDVPLENAYLEGFYDQMIPFIRSLFESALKTNPYLEKSVITGCLRISKESIFTGLNNFKVYSADDVQYDEEFGFTTEDVKKILAAYNQQEHFEEMKEWYDGYHFGNADIYCPWNVINYIDDLMSDSKAKPKAYWINSSGNDLVKRFIDKADTTTRDEIEQLITGKAVQKRIRLDLTYDEIDNSAENVWSVLFTTGYLTRLGESENGMYKLVIPNKEVLEVFILQIREWFDRFVANDQASTKKINCGFLEGKVEDIEQELTMFLGETISVLDTKARNEEKEIFYQGILIGILKSKSDWAVRSNRESGDGFADILVKPKNPDAGIIWFQYKEKNHLIYMNIVKSRNFVIKFSANP